MGVEEEEEERERVEVRVVDEKKRFIVTEVVESVLELMRQV